MPSAVRCWDEGQGSGEGRTDDEDALEVPVVGHG